MKLSQQQTKVFLTLFVIGLAANLDKGLIGAIAPYLADPVYMQGLGFDDALTKTQIGGLTTFFYVTFIVMTFVAGWFVDKFGYKIFVPICLALLIGGEIVFGIAGIMAGAGFAIMIVVARMIVGFGQAGYTNGTPPIIARVFDPEVRGSVQGRVVATAGLGTILVYLVFQPFIIKADFRNAFWIMAVLFAICLVMFILLVPGNPEPLASAANAPAPAAKKDVKITEAWTNRNVLVLAVTLLLNNLVGVALLNWANVMYKETFDPSTSALTIVMVGYGVTLLVATWTAADVIKKFFAGRERQFMFMMCAIGSVFLVATVLVPLYVSGATGFWLSAICLWLSSMAIMWAFGVILMLPYQTIPVRIIGSAFAVINIGAFVGGIVQGFGIGTLVDMTGGYVVPFIVMAVILLLSGLVPFLLKNKTPEELAVG